MLNTAATSMLYLLEMMGQQMTLKDVTQGSYDPSTGSYSNTSTDITLSGYVADYSLSEINNESIVIGDRKVILATVDTSGASIPTPKVGDKVTGVAKEVKIVSVRTIYEGTAPAVYICQVRQ